MFSVLSEATNGEVAWVGETYLVNENDENGCDHFTSSSGLGSKSLKVRLWKAYDELLWFQTQNMLGSNDYRGLKYKLNMVKSKAQQLIGPRNFQ